MSKHDYSQNTVSDIAEEISRNKSVIADSVLSTENMEYSWLSGITNNVVPWFEVTQINRLKTELEFILTRAESRLGKISGMIENTDYNTSVSLNNQLSNLISVSGKADALLNTITGYSSVKEVHGWKPEKTAKIYGLEKYISFDEKKHEYVVSDKLKLKKLLKKKEITAEEKETLIRILQLCVNDDGSLNTSLLSDFIECGYQKKKYVSDIEKHRHVFYDSQLPYYSYDYKYYAVYTKNKNLDETAELLDSEKYKSVKFIISNCNQSYTTEHTKLTLDFSLSSNMNEEKLLEHTISETENTFGNIEFDITSEKKEDKINNEEYKVFQVKTKEYTIHPQEKKKNKYEGEFHSLGSFNIYTEIDFIGTEEEILKKENTLNIENAANINYYDYNKFQQDEEFDIVGVIGGTIKDIALGELFSRTGQAIVGGEAGGVIGGGIYSLASAIDSELDRVNAAKETNEYIRQLKKNHKKRWNSVMLALADKVRVELMLNGYVADITIKKDHEGVIEDVIYKNATVQKGFKFQSVYENFYNKNNNDDINLPPPEKVENFQSLKSDIKEKLRIYYSNYSE
ncbi:MAG: hypothetical protein HDT23_09105 [Ruminococcus sp.]|nr:hypothetical protein [Ruminococcus sp.]